VNVLLYNKVAANNPCSRDLSSALPDYRATHGSALYAFFDVATTCAIRHVIRLAIYYPLVY